ncbi:hypothetical protein PIB30_014345 [Stylosanthes scabra]|uniref:Uncharacterized protein n=1 Tax=Stylosanthes scabra TaxID=79078 RepID=A0ABU6S6H4_9FABA|nr:hypothetical protein [Stylosanthes scabra]
MKVKCSENRAGPAGSTGKPGTDPLSASVHMRKPVGIRSVKNHEPVKPDRKWSDLGRISKPLNQSLHRFSDRQKAGGVLVWFNRPIPVGSTVQQRLLKRRFRVMNRTKTGRVPVRFNRPVFGRFDGSTTVIEKAVSCDESDHRKPAGSRFGLTVRFSAGSTVQQQLLKRQFRVMNRTMTMVGSPLNRFDRPIRSDFQNYDLNSCLQ